MAIGLFVMASSLFPVGCDSFTPSGEEALVDNVEVQKVPGNPPQYNAVVTGHFEDTCTRIGRTQQVKIRTTIQVTMVTVETKEGACSPVSTPFRQRVPLDVTGMVAGSYAVEVNGVTAPLTLTEDH